MFFFYNKTFLQQNMWSWYSCKNVSAGGIGEAVKSAVAMERDIIVSHLAVTNVPRSGKCDELLDMFGISASAVVKAAKEIIQV